MPVLTAYCTKLRKKVEMDQIELVTMKNGRPAAKGVAKEDPSLSVFRILSKAEAEELGQSSFLALGVLLKSRYKVGVVGWFPAWT